MHVLAFESLRLLKELRDLVEHRFEHTVAARGNELGMMKPLDKFPARASQSTVLLDDAPRRGNPALGSLAAPTLAPFTGATAELQVPAWGDPGKDFADAEKANDLQLLLGDRLMVKLALAQVRPQTAADAPLARAFLDAMKTIVGGDATLADVQAVHSSVQTAGTPVHKTRRLSVGDVVTTDGDGRARLRLDDGTSLVVDRETNLKLTEKGVDLEYGRIFVQGALGARTEVNVGGAVAIVSGANTGIERPKAKPSNAKLYAATEEITVRANGAEKTVHTGETASVEGQTVTVAPERGYDDWTGGMAAPWGAKGAPRRAVGELWGRPEKPGEAGSPLTIRAHDVDALVARELAETEVRTTFFNAGSDTVTGDYRLAIPPGAIVSRFASVRGGSTREGRIALATRGRGDTSGQSTELLEWAGEGWVRARIPGISPGASVDVIVRYVEWLSPRPKADGTWVVQYRYPMVSDSTPPLIGEFSARVDATSSGPRSIGAGLGARVTGSTVEVRRPDYRPTADLVVDVEIDKAPSPARMFVAPPFEGDTDDPSSTVLVRTEVPNVAQNDGVTLALVLDTSSSVEPALFDAHD